MRYETWYQATANSSGVLRIDGDLVVGKDRDDDHSLVTYFWPPIPLSEINRDWNCWNLRKDRADALKLYRAIEQERVDKAQRALAEVA